MGQITINLDDEHRIEWPMDVREAAGAWRDFPEVEQLRTCLGVDTEREPLE